MNRRITKSISRHGAEQGLWIVLLSIFMLSSLLKAVNIRSFALETRLYVDAYFGNLELVIPDLSGTFRMDIICAIAVCAVEMLVALLAIRQEYRRVASVGFFLMLTFFVCLTGLNLFFPTLMGSIESCGCFGELIHFSPAASFVKSVALWCVSLIPLVHTSMQRNRWNMNRLLKDRYLYICIATSIVPPMYSLWFFDALSHTVYVMVFAVLCVTLAANVILCIKKEDTALHPKRE